MTTHSTPMKRYLCDLLLSHIVLISYHGNLLRYSDLVQLSVLLLYTLYRKAGVDREWKREGVRMRRKGSIRFNLWLN